MFALICVCCLTGMAIDQVEKVLYVADSVSSVVLYCVQ